MRKGSKRLLRTGSSPDSRTPGGGLAGAGARTERSTVAGLGPVGSAPFPSPGAASRRTWRLRRCTLAPLTDPGADGSCPVTHPVKAKLASGIYHVPGGGNYERTEARPLLRRRRRRPKPTACAPRSAEPVAPG